MMYRIAEKFYGELNLTLTLTLTLGPMVVPWWFFDEIILWWSHGGPMVVL